MRIRMIVVVARLGVVALAGVLCAGCTVRDTIYLQNVKVDGPVNQPPVYVNSDAKPGDVRISPHAGIGNPQQIEGHVEGSSAKYATAGKNLLWNMSGSYVGADADITVSRSIALTFGVNSSAAQGESFLGGHAGLGFLFHGEDVSGRFDGGIQWQTTNYQAATVVEHEVSSIFSSPTTTVAYYEDIGRSTLLDYYGSLTVNSNNRGWPVNIFGQLAFSKQTLTSYTPRKEIVLLPLFPFYTHLVTDTRAQSSATFLIIPPGVYVDLGSWTRIVAGLRLLKEIEIADSNPNLIIMPLMQFDIKV